MIDHLSVTVSDYEASKAFYTAALAPLGYGVLMEIHADVAGTNVAGMGELATHQPDFWLTAGRPQTTNHVAFRAPDRQAVQRFYEAALAAGGRDNGAPGVRPHYHPNYYGAFVLDPDGHNIEAVCHGGSDAPA
jgi:catechol 2,3-dioxygenase-like lactoylglutathione lyase family enzyme